MACINIRFVTTPRRPDGFYVCLPPEGGAEEGYEPPLADLRAWCLTTDGNPDCPRRPKPGRVEVRWSGYWIPPLG